MRPNVLGGRTAAATAEERNATATVVGDPTLPGSAGGAVLTLIANGASPSSQSFALPQGTSSSGGPFWRAISGGFVYTDLRGEQGPVVLPSFFGARSQRACLTPVAGFSGNQWAAATTAVGSASLA